MKKRIENALFPVAFVMGSLGVLIASGVLLALVFAVAVKAQDGDRRDVRWATKRFCAHYSWDGSCSRYRYERRRVHVHQHYHQSASGITRRRDSGTETTTATASSSAGRYARP